MLGGEYVIDQNFVAEISARNFKRLEGELLCALLIYAPTP